MSDHYMRADGSLDHVEGSGPASRVFKPIAFFGEITVWEQFHAPPEVAPMPSTGTIGAWED